MMHDHVITGSEERLPHERTPSRGATANDEQRLVRPDYVAAKRTKHPTRH